VSEWEWSECVESVSFSVETVDKKMGEWVPLLRTCFVIANPYVSCVGPFYVLPYLNASSSWCYADLLRAFTFFMFIRFLFLSFIFSYFFDAIINQQKLFDLEFRLYLCVMISDNIVYLRGKYWFIIINFKWCVLDFVCPTILMKAWFMFPYCKM
jgi:hypothetical protein